MVGGQLPPEGVADVPHGHVVPQVVGVQQLDQDQPRQLLPVLEESAREGAGGNAAHGLVDPAQPLVEEDEGQEEDGEGGLEEQEEVAQGESEEEGAHEAGVGRREVVGVEDEVGVADGEEVSRQHRQLHLQQLYVQLFGDD